MRKIDFLYLVYIYSIYTLTLSAWMMMSGTITSMQIAFGGAKLLDTNGFECLSDVAHIYQSS